MTGNEDGAKHCAMNVLYSLQHLGYMIPPQADAAWLGEAGPSYLDDGSGGPENDFTNRNVAFMTWNLLHTAKLLRAAGGFPVGATSVPNGTTANAAGWKTPNTADRVASGRQAYSLRQVARVIFQPLRPTS